MKYNKVEALLKLKGFNLTDYAKHCNIVVQQIVNKKKTDSFKVDDLIKLADLTNTTLCFVDDKGKALISFDIDDISK